MDGMLNERMKQLLADPDALSRVMETASRLFSASAPDGREENEGGRAEMSEQGAVARGAEEQGSAEAQTAAAARRMNPPSPPPPPPPPLQSVPSEADRVRLLDAICPFLSPQRREAAESMLRIMKLLSLAERSGILGSLGISGGREG